MHAGSIGLSEIIARATSLYINGMFLKQVRVKKKIKKILLNNLAVNAL